MEQLLQDESTQPEENYMEKKVKAIGKYTELQKVNS